MGLQKHPIRPYNSQSIPRAGPLGAVYAQRVLITHGLEPLRKTLVSVLSAPLPQDAGKCITIRHSSCSSSRMSVVEKFLVESLAATALVQCLLPRLLTHSGNLARARARRRRRVPVSMERPEAIRNTRNAISLY